MYPIDRRYSKDHEWIQDEDGVARVGITDFAQKELGDIVFVELPEGGRGVSRGDVLGTIESVKAVSEIYAPISGTVTESNQALDARPEAVNEDPHGEGWYCRIRPSDPSEIEELMDAEAYAKLTEA